MLPRTVLPALLLLLAASCSTTTATYLAPTTAVDGDGAWVRQVEKPFDAVWEALVDHIAGTYFAIDNFEKASGLMTLSFGASDISDFVDGGHWTYHRTAGTDPVTGAEVGALHFEGNYASFLEQYLGGKLVGRINVFVRRAGADTTEVKVRARYVVTAVGGTVNTWSFNTGGSDTLVTTSSTKGTPPTRTQQPTHKAETSIIDAVERIASE